MSGQKSELKACLQNIRLFLLCGSLLIMSVSTACRSSLSTDSRLVLNPLTVDGLENVYQYNERIYGGSGPHTADNFAELKQLGIGMVISVDGATPKVELAEAEGLQYVHIPIAYGGINRAARLQLVKAYSETSDRIYVHCHHGKHRGPAAIASMLVGVGELDAEEGNRVLQEVGTSKNYQELYKAVRNARVISQDELKDAEPLVSMATVSDFTQAMAMMDVHWDHLKQIRKSGWVTTKEHPDIDPAHEALLLHEYFRELVRQDSEADYSAEDAALLEKFRYYLGGALELSAELESGLRQGAESEYLEFKFQALKQSCVNCHEVYRNSSNVEHRTLSFN